MKRHLAHRRIDRQGALLPLAAVCMCIVLGFLALSIDVGYICLTRVEAQNAADAAALSAANQLYPDPHPQTAIKLPINLPIYRPVAARQSLAGAIEWAQTSGAWNKVAAVQNPAVLGQDVRFAVFDGGVTVGPPATIELVDHLLDALNLLTADHTFVNSVEVTVRRDQSANGRLNLFFGPSVGSGSTTVKAVSQAAIFRGYGVSAGDKLLPFAMDVTVWNAMRFTNGEINAVTLQPLGINANSLTLEGLLGNNPLLTSLDDALPLNLSGSPLNILDEATWSLGMTTITPRADGIWEVLLPADQLKVTQSTGLLGVILKKVTHIPGLVVSLNFSNVHSPTPDASQLNRVIQSGLSPADIASRSATNDYRLWMPFSAAGHFEVPDQCEAPLRAIIGQPRILPLYATLPGTIQKATDLLGAAHEFQIVGWGAVVVTDVRLSGPIRYIKLQPAVYARSSVMAAVGPQRWRSQSTMSDGVYTAPRLVK